MNNSVFECFRRQVPFEDLEFYHDFMGVRIRKGLEIPRDSSLESPAALKGGFPVGQMSSGRATRMCADDPTMLHPDCEDFFEWTDMLTAVMNSGSTFQMIELGAGYGRWCTNAIVASRRLLVRARPTVRTFAVEMDPFKVKPLRKHLAANAADGECTFVQAVIDYGTENDIYFAWMADKFLVPVSDTANAYGSGIVRSKDVAQHLGANNFMVLPSGENLVVVNPVRRIRLEEIGTQGPVDFLTMDVQGEELNVVSGGIAYLNGNVRVMHIATHSAHVESMLKTLLMEHGWKLNYEIPRETYHATENGGVLFDDGIQCWINSRG